MKLVNWFKSEENGQGLVEYGLIIALIAVALIAALGLLGDGLNGIFERITDALND